ncbi:ribosomal protein LP1 [Haematobia irritans]|uniref:Large ribosomal subunit protein P1 n=2 Tax=Haematobia irritans TaxID=7368 RepID=A0A1L8EIE2_HAEIR
MSNKAELACVYASLILVDDDIAVTGEKISTVLKAANVEVEPYWPGLFAKALEGVNVKDLITNIGSGVGAAPAGGAAAPAGGAAPAAEAKKEEKKKEEEPEESDDDMGFALFD